MNEYVIVSGYVEQGDASKRANLSAPDFLNLWVENTISHTKPKAIIIISAGGVQGNVSRGNLLWLNMCDNLGHVNNMPKNKTLCGWSASFIAGCIAAYHANCDMIYKEQDCLAFGSWVSRLYTEIGTNGMITGRKNINGFLAQSLVLVKYDYLLRFVSYYLNQKESDWKIFPEWKFERIMRIGDIGGAMTTMGYDRSRPINYEDSEFYAQQLSQDEITELKRRGLI